MEEHLWFFARLRGLENDQVKKEMEQMIKDVGLPHKRKELSSSLSGKEQGISVAVTFHRVLINKNRNNVTFCDSLYCFDVPNFGYKEINDFP